ncbi:MAG: DUF4375 domain-containing protein [Fimbriimonadaceae bacterium]|nr:DUF4375 domain-containing protein [Fimbriimonadaceae bacterium]
MLKWLETYEGQSIEELLALRGTHYTRSLADAIYQAVDWKVHRENRDYTAFEVAVPAVLEFDNEVKNGGFYQFLTNYSGRFADSIVGSLHMIGATQSEAIARAAFEALPSDWKTRKREEVENLLAPYDQQFFESWRTDEELCEFLVTFIARNPERFSLPH